MRLKFRNLAAKFKGSRKQQKLEEAAPLIVRPQAVNLMQKVGLLKTRKPKRWRFPDHRRGPFKGITGKPERIVLTRIALKKHERDADPDDPYTLPPYSHPKARLWARLERQLDANLSPAVLKLREEAEARA